MEQKYDLTQTDWERMKAMFNEVVDKSEGDAYQWINTIRDTQPKIHSMLSEMLQIHFSSASHTVTPQIPVTSPANKSVLVTAGEYIGKFRVIEQIGAGGMGEVYLAEREDQVLQQVAIKLLNRQFDSQSQLRFDNERRIMAGFEHINIARLIDAGEYKGLSYYAMEYVQGQNIAQHCVENELSLMERLKLFVKVCDVVSYAHSNLIIHRDLKPGNILINAKGEIKLLDFGIAKPLKILPGTETVHETLAGITALTPQYAAPEQINGEAITMSCDIYLLGLLLYKIVTGQQAFELAGKSWGEIEQIINNDMPILPSKVRQDNEAKTVQNKIKGDLDAIIYHALKKQPEERYASVRELATDIKHYLAREPIQIRHTQNLYRIKKQLRKHWLPVSALSVIFTVLATASVLVFQQSKTISEERDKALIEKQLSEKVTSFLIDTFKSADPTKTLGMQLTAGDILKQGVNQLKQQNPSSEVKNRLLSALSEVYMNLSAFDEAEDLVSQITDESLLSQENRGDLAVVRAQILFERGQVEGALSAIEAVDLNRNEKSELYFKVMNFKVFLLEKLDKSYEARDLSKVLADEAKIAFGDDSFTYAIQLREYGERLSSPDDLSVSIKLFNDSLAVMDDLTTIPDPLEYLETKRTLMIELRRNQEFDKALALSFDLEKEYLDIFSPDHVTLASLYTSRGIMYSQTHRIEDSLESYKKSKEIYTKALGENSSRVVSVDMNIGVVYMYELADPEAAKPHFETALTKLVSTVGKRKRYFYINVPYAACLIMLNQDAEAIIRINESLDFYQSVDAEGAPINLLAKSLKAHLLIKEGAYAPAHDLLYSIQNRLMKHWGKSIHRPTIDQDIAVLERELGVVYAKATEVSEIN